MKKLALYQMILSLVPVTAVIAYIDKKGENSRMINYLAAHLSVISFILIFCLSASSQEPTTTKNKTPFPVKYTSLIDQKIILKTLTLAPVYDNVNGIYSNPIQKLLVDLLQSDKVWGYSEFPEFEKKIFIEKFDSQPNDVIEVLEKTKSQGLLTAFVTKGPRGLNAKLKLFTQDQGLILIEESFLDINTFEISKLREIFVTMYHNIKNKLPYRGYVLSRRGLDVTLNLGSINGIQAGQELVLAQILKINRHPKLKIMIGAEKEIIAKLKVTKVEPYLSFAQIIFEKETGVVDIGAKVLPTEYVGYPIPQINAEGVVLGDAYAKAPKPEIATEDAITPKSSENAINEGKAQLLDKHNSSGVLTAQGVITQYNESTSLLSGVNPNTSNSLAPGAYLGAQLYFFDRLIFVDFNTQMNMFSGDNNLSGSTPYHLSYTFSRYTAAVGYDYMLNNDNNEGDEDNPIKLTAALGFTSIKTDVSTTTPTSLTSTETAALDLQLKAEMPLAPDYPLTVGAKFDLFLSPNFSESPVNSGSGKASLTSLGLFGIYPVSDKLRIRADLGVTNISATFSGAGTRTNPSASTSIQTLNEQLGVEYLF